jgi:glycosyltransferase involved in cell wall biosynthesis
VARPQLVSVLMPLRNERRHVAEQLDALAGQTYLGRWELVVADNGSSDGSSEVVRSLAGAIPGLRLVDASARRGLNHARNAGVAAARGDFVAFCDADDVAAPGWLEALAAAAPDADVVAGPLDFEALNDPLSRSWRRGLAWAERRHANGFFVHVPGGNCAMRTPLARELRWDEAFTYGSADAEFSWRAQALGLRVGIAPGALMRVRYPPGLRGLASQFFRYGHSQPRLFRRHRGDGMPRSDFAEALADWRGLAAGLPSLWRCEQKRGRWVRSAALRCGRAAGSVRHRVFYP